ncbi:serine carboxypeptidase-like 45 [Benincasa hispida]|uniref:serine carboxypeptidase-like 45 n=1 Tax=Benincasa hispida TaxID=102211 RepID=UPI0018FFD2D9|nr:serine carboxypeptidase-like 45 [Benincasa hispida]
MVGGLLWAILCLRGECSKEKDRIVRLPGQPSVSFQQFSGYIIIDDYQNRALFYYFVEAHTDPSSKPLLLWLDGGPGCSSLGVGAFVEHGPFRPKGDVLIHNHFSWNNVANILYLESPAGVGFSFSENTTFYTTVNDTITAQDNLVFLERWFEKFPKYKNRDFFISGESYAGHYVPQLATLILQSELNIFNLKAIAVGNPLLEFDTDFNARGEYLWSHGLISDSTYQLLNKVCNISEITRQSILHNVSTSCSMVNNLVSKELSEFINLYSVNLHVCTSSTLSQAGDSGKIDVCIADEVDSYLNRLDVQKALHAQLLGGASNWSFCSFVLKYDKKNLMIPTIYTLGSLVQSGIRVLVYSGDEDAVIPLFGSRSLVNKLATTLSLNTTLPYSPWFYNHQVGGWVETYGEKNILSFATVREGAHQAPYTAPGRSLALITAFLQGNNP